MIDIKGSQLICYRRIKCNLLPNRVHHKTEFGVECKIKLFIKTAVNELQGSRFRLCDIYVNFLDAFKLQKKHDKLQQFLNDI